MNRNLDLLAAIRRAVRCDLPLIANHACLVNCAMQPYHQNGFAHSSHGSKQLFVDYCFLRCSRARLREPSSFIKAQWIRPEDIAAYESMGYESFKLLERAFASGVAACVNVKIDPTVVSPATQRTARGRG